MAHFPSPSIRTADAGGDAGAGVPSLWAGRARRDQEQSTTARVTGAGGLCAALPATPVHPAPPRHSVPPPPARRPLNDHANADRPTAPEPGTEAGKERGGT